MGVRVCACACYVHVRVRVLPWSYHGITLGCRTVQTKEKHIRGRYIKLSKEGGVSQNQYEIFGAVKPKGTYGSKVQFEIVFA